MPEDIERILRERAEACRPLDGYLKADMLAAADTINMLRAEVEMLRGVGCSEDGDGPCGACIKCAKAGTYAGQTAVVAEPETFCPGGPPSIELRRALDSAEEYLEHEKRARIEAEELYLAERRARDELEAENLRLREALQRVVGAASELTSWDWPRLLIDCADSEVAVRDAAFLEEQLPQARTLLDETTT